MVIGNPVLLQIYALYHGESVVPGIVLSVLSSCFRIKSQARPRVFLQWLLNTTTVTATFRNICGNPTTAPAPGSGWRDQGMTSSAATWPIARSITWRRPAWRVGCIRDVSAWTVAATTAVCVCEVGLQKGSSVCQRNRTGSSGSRSWAKGEDMSLGFYHFPSDVLPFKSTGICVNTSKTGYWTILTRHHRMQIITAVVVWQPNLF